MLQYLAQAFGCPVSQIFLPAEELAKQNNPPDPDWQKMPAGLLFMQLPEDMQPLFKKLFVEIITQRR
ncbi:MULTISPECIES: hypothetical protein [unclassified Neisseria]|nr:MULTISPECIES: hypothetical protein [unclassified Neisseria]